MTSVANKLELAIKTYIAATYQGVGEELNGVAIYMGHTPEEMGADSHLIVKAGSAGGPHINQGNYEIPVSFAVVTSMEKESTDTETSLRIKHGQRVEAINGIFAESRTATVTAALMATDADLGVSSYWPEGGIIEDNDETALRTIIVKIFEAYIAPA